MERPSLVHRFFSLQPGEVKQTLNLIILAALTFATTYGINAVIDGLFLDRVGPTGLPVVFLYASLACLLLASPTLQALTHLSARKLFCFFCTGGFVFLLAGAYFLSSTHLQPGQLFWYTANIACEAYLIIMYTQVWAFIDQCTPPHSAKRLYGIFSASTLLGAAGGSGLVAMLIKWCSPATIFVLFAGMTLIVLLVALNTRPSTQLSQQGERLQMTTAAFLRQIIRSPYVLVLLTFNTLMLFLQVVTEFSYLSSIETAYAGAEAMTRFIGQCRGWTFLGMTLFGIFFYSRMIRRLGLRRAIVVPPLYFVILFLAWTFGDGLILGIMGVVAVEGILAGMEDSNFNLMVNAVDPRLKAKLRVTAEQVFEPAAMVMSSALLLSFQHGSKLLGLLLSSASLVAVIALRAVLPKETQDGFTPQAAQHVA